MIGARLWTISAGRVPLQSVGPEPAFTSRDLLSLLNAGETDVQVSIMLCYTDREPIGPYELEVRARRVRKVRINDLIDPEAPPLDEPYGAIVRADAPIVIQFSRQDTGAEALAGMMTTAFAGG